MSLSCSRVIYFVALVFFLSIFPGCKTYTPVQIQVNNIGVFPAAHFDSTTYFLYSPYKAGLEEEMRRPLAISGTDLNHTKPESSLGNHIVEVLRWSIQQNLGVVPDFCFYNFGGIRMPFLAKGNLYVEDAYKLLPFDNVGVVLEIPGSVVLQIFETMARNGGWPITGASYHISNGSATNIYINNAPLDTGSTYLIGTIDFLALGGDNMDYLKDFEFLSSQVLMRDALMAYWEKATADGREIMGYISGKVTSDEE